MSGTAFDSSQDPSYTYVNDKLTCLSSAYHVHVIFCDLAFAAGVLAMLSRLLPPWLKWVHRWFGVLYVISMLFIMGSSLIIHNEGLPVATLVSFVWVLGGLSLGWVAALVHKHFVEVEAVRRVERRVQTEGVTSVGLAAMLAEERAAFAASKGFAARILSTKALHGAFMFTSWINIAGRIFASNQSGGFTCYSYPGAASACERMDCATYAATPCKLTRRIRPSLPRSVYKTFDPRSGGQADTPLPVHDPNFGRLPWAKTGLVGWAIALSVGPFLGAILLGAASAAIATRNHGSGQDAAASAPAGAASATANSSSWPPTATPSSPVAAKPMAAYY
jgi:uncharacterized membrane protein